VSWVPAKLDPRVDELVSDGKIRKGNPILVKPVGNIFKKSGLILVKEFKLNSSI
jgi:hypothetical protein